MIDSQTEKHLWQVDTEFIVAKDFEHVIQLYSDEIDDWAPDRPVTQVPDEKPFEILFPEFEGAIDSGPTKIPANAKVRQVEESDYVHDDEYKFVVTATAREWAEANLFGIISTEEY